MEERRPGGGEEAWCTDGAPEYLRQAGTTAMGCDASTRWEVASLVHTTVSSGIATTG